MPWRHTAQPDANGGVRTPWTRGVFTFSTTFTTSGAIAVTCGDPRSKTILVTAIWLLINNACAREPGSRRIPPKHHTLAWSAQVPTFASGKQYPLNACPQRAYAPAIASQARNLLNGQLDAHLIVAFGEEQAVLLPGAGFDVLYHRSRLALAANMQHAQPARCYRCRCVCRPTPGRAPHGAATSQARGSARRDVSGQQAVQWAWHCPVW